MGLYHTHYANAHGLDEPGHYTTARDLATLALAALRSPTFAAIVSSPEYILAPTGDHQRYDWKNTNLLLSTMRYAGVDGVKTGFTGDAGGCLVFSASRTQGRLLGVVLDEPYGQDDSTRFTDAASLLTWGFTVESEQART
jgi:D-alanyl-D-alanine carboxypeptidase (penicillin-binding protein 5/6)